jgi:uncharacterized RDD family membrane protein YckC
VRIDEETVSRSHALLSVRKGQVVVRDLGSSNGLFINGQRALRESRLKSGDVIGLGSATLSVMITAPPDAPDMSTAAIETGSGLHLVRPSDGIPAGEKITLKQEPVGSESNTPAPSLAPVRTRPALLSRRFLSGLIDLALSLLIAFVCFSFALVAIIARSSMSERAASDPLYPLLIGFCACVAAAFVSVYFLSGWAGRGATFGQRKMGIRLLSEDGGFVKSGAALLRLFGLALCVATGGLLFLTILLDRDGRGFADRLSRSRVVEA